MKQRQVVAEELRQVDIDDGTQHQNVLVLIGILQLQTIHCAEHQ